MLTQKAVSPDEKREALDKVLASETFARSQQLRHFLQYVCEMDLAGRGEINEYIIGVDVLRRPKGYLPGNDSSVRSRAYELRHRLERYYEKESPNSPLRIELPKGSYTPVFIDGAAPRPAALPDTSVEVQAEPQRRARRWPLLAAFLAGALPTLAVAVFWLQSHAAAGVGPIVREAWGPLAHPAANVLILIGSTLHMNVRPNWNDVPGGPPRYKAFPELYPYFRKERPLKPGVELFILRTAVALIC